MSSRLPEGFDIRARLYDPLATGQPVRSRLRSRKGIPSRRGPSRQGESLHDLLFLPMGYERAYRYPLVVWLTDSGNTAENGSAFDLGRAMKRLSLRNFVSVLPLSGQGVDRERGVWRAIDRATREANIHPDRIFLVGDRDGGTDAFRIGCRHPEAFGGVVSLGGAFPLGEATFANLGSIRRLPMLVCCNRTADTGSTDGPLIDAVSIDTTLRLFHAAGAMLAMRIYPGRDTLSRAVLGDVNRWLMEEVTR